MPLHLQNDVVSRFSTQSFTVAAPISGALLSLTATPQSQSFEPELLALLGKHIRRGIIASGLVSHPPDIFSLMSWTIRSATLLRLLTTRPFCRLRDLADACRCDVLALEKLLCTLLNNDEIRDFLMESQSSSPYYRNTIRPIIDSGALAAFTKGEFVYPFTVGIYPAVSCMLSCSFCGRARGVQYDPANTHAGNELLHQLIAEAPTDRPRRFYLSGGLEPLTNLGLDQLVRFAASRGHRMQLYTNGMMLTRNFLEKHPGLWDLETIRISLYGANDTVAERTTSRPGVATRVIANAKEFARYRSECGSSVKLAFNHVVLSGQVDHLREIAHAIVDIAHEAHDRDGVDFLSLREDYASSGEASIKGDERKQLRDELLAIQSFFASEGLTKLRVDFGYAMQALLDGYETQPVHRVTHAETLGRGYPQISVAVDLLGDVYLYREAAFIGRVGADRYIIGRLGRDGNFENILRRFIAEPHRNVVPQPGDELFLDAFDHAVTAYLRQLSDDVDFTSSAPGFPLIAGQIKSRLNWARN